MFTKYTAGVKNYVLEHFQNEKFFLINKSEKSHYIFSTTLEDIQHTTEIFSKDYMYKVTYSDNQWHIIKSPKILRIGMNFNYALNTIKNKKTFSDKKDLLVFLSKDIHLDILQREKLLISHKPQLFACENNKFTKFNKQLSFCLSLLFTLDVMDLKKDKDNSLKMLRTSRVTLDKIIKYLDKKISILEEEGDEYEANE